MADLSGFILQEYSMVKYQAIYGMEGINFAKLLRNFKDIPFGIDLTIVLLNLSKLRIIFGFTFFPITYLVTILQLNVAYILLIIGKIGFKTAD